VGHSGREHAVGAQGVPLFSATKNTSGQHWQGPGFATILAVLALCVTAPLVFGPTQGVHDALLAFHADIRASSRSSMEPARQR
jgi:hypothetical protein